ncbi:hypothetical protein R2F61_05410 [Mollicutes bacterium LVI A0078]|nr:hypothetical protein RZE84_05430 [Mollicutes bacterium LVI A0075]WOO90167.1 hypothetical protein R2F61_05410 [Mollicutes bacterium LVI A0078]
MNLKVIENKGISFIKYMKNYDYGLFLKIYAFMLIFILTYIYMGYKMVLVNPSLSNKLNDLYVLGLVCFSVLILNVGRFVYDRKNNKVFSPNSFGAFAYCLDLVLFVIFLEFISNGQKTNEEFAASLTTLLVTIHAFTIMVPFNLLREFRSEIRLKPKYKFGKKLLTTTQVNGEELYVSIFSNIKYILISGGMLFSVPLLMKMLTDSKVDLISASLMITVALLIGTNILFIGEYIQVLGDKVYSVEIITLNNKKYYRIKNKFIDLYINDKADKDIKSILVDTESDIGKNYLEKNKHDFICINLMQLEKNSLISLVYQAIITKSSITNALINVMVLFKYFEYVVLLWLSTFVLFKESQLAIKIIILIALVISFPYLLLYKEKGSYNQFEIYEPAFKMRLTRNETLVLENIHLLSVDQTRELNCFIEKMKDNNIKIVASGNLELFRENIKLSYPNLNNNNANIIINEFYSRIIE